MGEYKVPRYEKEFDMLKYLTEECKVTKTHTESDNAIVLDNGYLPILEGMKVYVKELTNGERDIIKGIAFLQINDRHEEYMEYGATDLIMLVKGLDRTQAKNEVLRINRLEAEKDNPVYLDEKGRIIPYYLATYLVEKYTIISDKLNIYMREDGVYKEMLGTLYKQIEDCIEDKTKIKNNMVNEVTQQARQQTLVEEVKHARGYIYFENGLYNINERKFVEPTKDIIILGKVPYSYKKELADIKGTRFESFITSSLNEAYLPVIQELIGVCLYPVTDKRAYFYMLTGGGRNGKGVLMDLILHLIPKCLVSHISVSDFDKRFISSAIKGKTLNVCLDDKATRLEEIGNLKSVTAGEPIMVEKKGVDAQIIQPYLTHISSFNKIPSMNEKASAFFDRMINIRFDVQFGEAEEVAKGTKDALIDKGLKSYILEHEIEKVLAWGIEGLYRLIDNDYKFTVIDELEEAKASYRKMVDTVMNWGDLELVPIEGGVSNCKNSDLVKASALYQRYKEWCTNEGHIPVGRASFNDSMRSLYKKQYKSYNNSDHYAIFNE